MLRTLFTEDFCLNVKCEYFRCIYFILQKMQAHCKIMASCIHAQILHANDMPQNYQITAINQYIILGQKL